METYHKIQTLFKRDMDGSLTGKKGKMMEGVWTTPELEYLADKPWNFREKVDGTNIRVGWNAFLGSVEFGGRTDSAVIPKPLLAHLHDTFTPELFFTAGLLGNFILFGEGYGPKIQGGGKYRDDHSFVLFDIVSKGDIIEEWNTNHSDQQNAIPTAATSQEVSASHAIARDSDRSLSSRKSGTSGQESTATLTSSEPTILKRTESGIFERSLASLSKGTRKCLSCKVEFAPSATSQKLLSAGLEPPPHLPLTIAMIRYVFEAYCAEHVMSVCNRLTGTPAGLRPQQPTSHDFWLSNDNVADVAEKLGIDSVPLVGTGTLYDAISIVAAPGGLWRSAWGDFIPEGIVATPVVDLFDRKGNRIITKIKAVDFR